MKCSHSGTCDRRQFLRMAGLATLAGSTVQCAGENTQAEPGPPEAAFYDHLENGQVQCGLCPWECLVEPGMRGICGVRENRGGTFHSLVYGRPVAVNNDPVEKKPLFHVFPGSQALSIATVGCNIHCKFCQNWDISQTSPDRVKIAYRSPAEIVDLARQFRSKTIAYTYNEPTVFYEYMRDCARAGKEAGIGSVAISNGFISRKPMVALVKDLTAIKIDLKAFTDKFYEDVCEGRLQPVLDTLKLLADHSVWFEIVVLIIPTLNDSMDEIKRMSEWIVKNTGPDVPLHFTRFHNAYKIRNLHSTPPRTLEKARSTAMQAGCRYVYTGNMPGGEGESTYCPNCSEVLIHRYGYRILESNIKSGKCPKCATAIPGIWE